MGNIRVEIFTRCDCIRNAYLLYTTLTDTSIKEKYVDLQYKLKYLIKAI